MCDCLTVCVPHWLTVSLCLAAHCAVFRCRQCDKIAAQVASAQQQQQGGQDKQVQKELITCRAHNLQLEQRVATLEEELSNAGEELIQKSAL